MNWIKSTKCEQVSCVEVAFENAPADWPTVGVRNSQVPGETVWFTRDEWTVFLAGVRNGEFDV